MSQIIGKHNTEATASEPANSVEVGALPVIEKAARRRPSGVRVSRSNGGGSSTRTKASPKSVKIGAKAKKRKEGNVSDEAAKTVRESATTIDVAGAVERVAAALAGGDLATDFSELEDAPETNESEQRALMELTALARGMRRAIGRLQRAADSVEQIAGRVLEGGRVLATAVNDEVASVDSTVSSIAEINASARAVAGAVGALSHLAQSTSTSSLQMAASIDEVSISADALTAFVEETASSIEEMAASVRNVAASSESLAVATDETERSMRAIDESTQRVGLAVSETAVLAEEVQRSAEQGSAIVLETAESMRATRRGIEDAVEIIASLGERSERIGAITRVIDGIAERTNLLALNARILAAQAGQQGRGFAVVAEEIKELSERTARSTDEIDELIKGVRDGVGAVTGQTASNRQLADEGVRLAERAAASLHEISYKTGLSATAIRQIAEAAATQSLESHQVTGLVIAVRQRMEEIERATSEQARTAALIGGRAVHMADLTKQVSRAAEEQAEASKYIAGAMEQLTEVVSQIGGAVGEQHRGTEDVLRSIEVIREAVAHNQSSIVQINFAAGSLDYEAASLRDSVGHFKMPAPRRGGQLAYGVPDDVPSLDVLESTTVASSDILGMILEGLVRAGEGAEVEAVLAESWEISADGRTYSFHLREGVHFHNNRAMHAADVVYSIRRTLRESKAGAGIFMDLVGAPEFARGETQELPGVRERGRYTIELELTESLAFFLSMLCMHHAAVVPREEIEFDGGARFMKHPVGTGPFRVADYDLKKRRVALVRFENYWDAGKPYAEGVTIEFGQTGEDLYERLHRGELTFLHGEAAAENIKRFTADREWRSCTVVAAQLHTNFLVFDAEQPPFNDVRVRRAVGHAINKKQLVAEAYGDLAVAAAGPIPPGQIGHDTNYKGLEYDPERARRLLREAGCDRRLQLTLWRSFAEHTVSAVAGQLICEQLAEVGIKCAVHLSNKAEMREAILGGRAQLAEVSWYADYADPDNFTYALFNSAHRLPLFKRLARVREIDVLTSQARTLINRVERARIYAKLQQLIAEEALCAFVTHRRAAVIHRRDVEGLHAHLVHPVVRPEEIWLTKNQFKVQGSKFKAK